MPLKFTPDLDLFASGASVLVNPVNCVGVMGAGLARAFRERFPEMMSGYEEACSFGRLRPGEFSLWAAEDGQKVMNLATKDHFRDPSRPEYVGSGLFYLSLYLQAKKPESLALPMIGCGLGGLEWSRVGRAVTRYLGSAAAAEANILVAGERVSVRDDPVIYAGIGSRETPEPVLKVMTETAARLGAEDWTLQSGGAVGADTAFEQGALKKRIFYANEAMSECHFSIARRMHPAPHLLKDFAMKLMARNCSQVLGEKLDRPVDIVLAYTKGGMGAGGTGQALRIARRIGLPVIDLGAPENKGITAEDLAEKAKSTVARYRETLDRTCDAPRLAAVPHHSPIL